MKRTQETEPSVRAARRKEKRLREEAQERRIERLEKQVAQLFGERQAALEASAYALKRQIGLCR